MAVKQLRPSIVVWCKKSGGVSSVTWLCGVQTKTALSRMTREHDNVTAQLTQAEQVKLVAEGELAEVGKFTCLIFSARLLLFEASQGQDSNWQSSQ